MSAELWVARLQTTPYGEARALQNELRAARQAAAIPDVLLLLEHWPVYTRGRRTGDDELPMGEDWYAMQGIEVAATDRGGRVTYHGPGQLVAYPIIDLGAYGDDVHAYVRRLERVMISALRVHGIPAQVFEGLTGVWTAGEPPLPAGENGPQGTRVGPAAVASPDGSWARKIGSIGVHVSRGVTTHGLAINVSNDLQPFEWIVPCGIEYVRMTSLTAEQGSRQEVGACASTVAAEFAGAFAREPREIALEELLAAASVTARAEATPGA